MPDDMNLWRRKLAAYLHDPPEKPYDYGRRHLDRAKTHAESFGVAELWGKMGGNPDWSAAAADRFVFPHGSKLGDALGEEPSIAFVHPLAGRPESGKPSLPASGLEYPGQDQAEAWLSQIRPEWKSNDPQEQFLRAWRKWSDHAAEHAAGETHGAELLPYLPADTRIPDASIWHHCAVVSALEGTRPDSGGALAPAFVIFQVGPVQEFISQARSTRDLWSGSYLLSWITMHAIKHVADRFGPDAIIFPSLKGQPLYEFLERRLDLPSREQDVLVPGIPNRFLAVVPRDFDPVDARNALMDEWKLIASECRQWLVMESQGRIPFAPPFDTLFEQQIERHWQVSWQLLPWSGAGVALKDLSRLPLGRNNPLHLASVIAENIPEAHRDDRCYRDRGLDPGWAWAAHYQLTQHALDACRSLRDFRGTASDIQRKPGERDCLSGREEAVLQADAIDKLKSPTLRALFRHAEPLGAANLIKRVWHRAYLARLREVKTKGHLANLQRVREAFDSVPAVAAGAFVDRLFTATESEGPLREVWQRFLAAATSARHEFPDSVADLDRANERQWLDCTDHSVFFREAWRREAERPARDGPGRWHSPEARERLLGAEAALQDLLTHAKAQPSSYYAVLALDGDQIGRWLSGEKSPAVDRVLSPKAREYFSKKMLAAMTPGEMGQLEAKLAELAAEGKAPAQPEDWQGEWPPQQPADWIRIWLASPRPLSPSWHLQFSEALANFGLHAARRIVQGIHHGQLIYSGGDDVLAMLPADEAIACATNLRAAFQGRVADMTPECRQFFRPEAPEGFLWLKDPRGNDPCWPLLVPGPEMTVSVGIAVGHVKEPLQDLVQEAQRAEKRAKAPPERLVFNRSASDPALQEERWVRSEGWDRNALAVTLFKRSGEMIRWGARFSSAAFPLFNTMRHHFRAPWGKPEALTAITGRFPHRLAELLAPYGSATPISELKEVLLREVEFVISRQTLPNEGAAKLDAKQDATPFRRTDLLEQCAAYLEELAGFSWKRPGQKAPTLVPCMVHDFVNLFLLEAFIRRQAD